jgi:hypothetical protein
LINQAKVIGQDQYDFNKQIKKIQYDLMLSEYPKEFITSIMKKPSRSNDKASEIPYQDTVIILYIKGIPEKLKTVLMSGLLSRLNEHYVKH